MGQLRNSNLHTVIAARYCFAIALIAFSCATFACPSLAQSTLQQVTPLPDQTGSITAATGQTSSDTNDGATIAPASVQPWWERLADAIGWGGLIGAVGAILNFIYTNSQARRLREADVNSSRFKEDFCNPIDVALKAIIAIPDSVDAVLHRQTGDAERAVAIAELQRQEFDPSQLRIQEVLISSDTTKWVDGNQWASAVDENLDQIYAAFNSLANAATPANKREVSAAYLRQQIRILKQTLTDKFHAEHRRIHAAPHNVMTNCGRWLGLKWLCRSKRN